ncbi:heterokaryon incompatibility protein-domain-containing protein [Cercophora newfieldiana]|uniref:Heterokaryon incompatibility protein-domain-containing protein n=1 Tax=Cercophora newfieldiana TaxID=92897 RepID=A0AA40CMM9_9PEZI|nr:heterokaryon incompatibility protein-domain-containing protein [Cercophora newfieldiana]
MPLCPRCQTLSIVQLLGTEILFQPDLPTLKRNADQGCDFCTLCWHVLRDSTRDHHDQLDRLLQGKSAWADGEEWTPTIWLLGLSLMDRSGEARASIEVSVGKTGTFGLLMVDGKREEDQNPEPYIRGSLAVYEDPGRLSRYKLFGRRSTVDRNPELYLGMIRHWLHDCQTKHEVCKGDGSGGVMPTRVIDVGESGTLERTPHVRLVSTQGMSERYIALSYCWGPDTSDIFTLNTSTHAAMTSTQGVQVSTLARTHREIIDLARALGIRYVWVDALCIIQGDAADWEKESKTMARVYGNSTLTIIAGRSPSSKSGFLTNDLNKDNTRPLPCRLPVTLDHPPTSDPETVTIDLRRSHNIGPLVQRGWCFQERLSAPRSVLFAEEQISFLCNREHYWEDGWVSRNAWRPKFVQQQPQWAPDPKLPLTPAEETLQGWYWMLFHYTQCLLSNPHDIFAAICAVAQQAARTLVGSRYLAGIWECDIVRGLLWRPCYHFQLGPAARVETTRPKPTRLTQGTGPIIRAPSWSWAAVEGPIAYPYFNASQVAKYRDTGYSMIRPGCPGSKWSLDTTCGVDTLHMPECELRLVGRVGYALTPGKSVKEYVAGAKARGGFKSSLARAVFHGVLLLAETQGANPERWQEDVVGVGFFDDGSERNGVDGVWCLPVVRDLGLILRKDSDGRFSRLGWFIVEKEAWFASQPEVDVCLR